MFVIDEKLCTGCKKCVTVCPAAVWEEEKWKGHFGGGGSGRRRS